MLLLLVLVELRPDVVFPGPRPPLFYLDRLRLSETVVRLLVRLECSFLGLLFSLGRWVARLPVVGMPPVGPCAFGSLCGRSIFWGLRSPARPSSFPVG